MNSISAQHKILALLGGGISQSVPTTERIARLPTILGFSPYMRTIYPNLVNSVLFHRCLFLIKIFFPSLYNNIFILKYDRFNEGNIMFLKAMAVYLL